MDQAERAQRGLEGGQPVLPPLLPGQASWAQATPVCDSNMAGRAHGGRLAHLGQSWGAPVPRSRSLVLKGLLRTPEAH